MGFFFLLRRSEYLMKGKQVYRYAIKRSDVSFADSQGRVCNDKRYLHQVRIRFRGSKNDQAGAVPFEYYALPHDHGVTRCE